MFVYPWHAWVHCFGARLQLHWQSGCRTCSCDAVTATVVLLGSGDAAASCERKARQDKMCAQAQACTLSCEPAHAATRSPRMPLSCSVVSGRVYCGGCQQYSGAYALQAPQSLPHSCACHGASLALLSNSHAATFKLLRGDSKIADSSMADLLFYGLPGPACK